MKAQNRPVQAAVNQLKPVTPKWPIRRWVRIAHLWAGVGLGLWIVMLGLTGSALVYQHSLRQPFGLVSTVRWSCIGRAFPTLPISPTYAMPGFLVASADSRPIPENLISPI